MSQRNHDDDTDPPEPEPPRFDREAFIDRGYYLVTQFQDEKRRRDRAQAVQAARRHPSYICLMTPDNRLVHRNVYRREQLPQFLELQNLISTWTSPDYFVLGYEIEVGQLLEGIHCYQSMGETCNPLLDDAPYPSYLGCPRASISFKYMHPRAWYSLYVPTRSDPKRFVRVVDPEADAEAHDLDPEAAARAYRRGLGELRAINRQYCGCPLINLRRVEQIYTERLPAELRAGEGIWRIAPDVMGEPSLQPRSKALYLAFLDELKLDDLPCSDRPDAGRPTEAEEAAPAEDEGATEAAAAEARRREMLSRFSWLLDE